MDDLFSSWFLSHSALQPDRNIRTSVTTPVQLDNNTQQAYMQPPQYSPASAASPSPEAERSVDEVSADAPLLPSNPSDDPTISPDPIGEMPIELQQEVLVRVVRPNVIGKDFSRLKKTEVDMIP